MSQSNWIFVWLSISGCLCAQPASTGKPHDDIGESIQSSGLPQRGIDYERDEALLLAHLSHARQQPPPPQSSLIAALNALSRFYFQAREYAKSEHYWGECLQIPEIQSNPQNLAAVLRHRALAQAWMGRLVEAEAGYRAALALKQKSLGASHPDVAGVLLELAPILQARGRSSEARNCLQKALAIQEAAFGHDHPDVFKTLTFLGESYRAERRYAEAERVWKRETALLESINVPVEPKARALCSLGSLYVDTGRAKDAEQYFLRALTLVEGKPGGDIIYVAVILGNLAAAKYLAGNLRDAEELDLRALAIEESDGNAPLETAWTLENLAIIYTAKKRFGDAEPMFVRSLALKEKFLGTNHTEVAGVLNRYAAMLKLANRKPEASRMVSRARAISANSLTTRMSDMTVDVQVLRRNK